MSSTTLGQFLLSRYQGALLQIKEPGPVIPDTIRELVNPLDEMFTECVRFKFKQKKPSLVEVRDVLIEYYRCIRWVAYIDEPEQERIDGSVHAAEAEIYLILMSFYDNEDADVLVVVTNPLLA